MFHLFLGLYGIFLAAFPLWLAGLLFLFEGLLACYFEEKAVLSFPFLVEGLALTGAVFLTDLRLGYILFYGVVCTGGLLLTAVLVRRSKKRGRRPLDRPPDGGEIDPATGRKRTPPI